MFSVLCQLVAPPSNVVVHPSLPPASPLSSHQGEAIKGWCQGEEGLAAITPACLFLEKEKDDIMNSI